MVSGGRSARNKGRRGQAAFKNLLRDRDWIVHEINAGEQVEDMIATSPDGVTYSVEVKNQKILNVESFRKQAMSQASRSRKPWLLGMKIPGESAWLVMMKGERSSVWQEKGR